MLLLGVLLLGVLLLEALGSVDDNQVRSRSVYQKCGSRGVKIVPVESLRLARLGG